MSSAPEAKYDRDLLAQTPAVTRTQLQQGYDSVLLAPNRRAKRTDSDVALNEGKVNEPAAPSRSCWHGRGKTILVLLIVLVIIAAIVGGAVGATVRKKQAPPPTVDVGTATLSLSSGLDQSGIFGSPSSTSATKSFSLDSVAIGTEPVGSSDIFPQSTARHCATVRRR
ncbi:hypothetical protein DFH09DRAFT_595215 [Mycena vulgaris]|nr:hypothetical protein DFH09DRAFT_595215 [Mycena vulgaris]